MTLQALAGMAQLVRASSHKLESRQFNSQSGHNAYVAGLVPGWGMYERQPTDVSLPLSPSIPLSLKLVSMLLDEDI